MTDSVHVSTESRQDYATPPELVALIADRFGVSFVIDLAADGTNAKAPNFLTASDDSLSRDWNAEMARTVEFDLLPGPAAWINPPFKRAAPWMEKCAAESAKGMKIISLTLSSLGSNWYRDHVNGKAFSLILQDRVTFVGCDASYTKELMVTLWGFKMTGLGFWSWKGK